MGYVWLYWFTTLYWVIGSIDQFMNRYKAVNRTGTKKVRRTSKNLKMEQREPACTWNIFLFHILEGLRRAFVWIFWGGTCNLRHKFPIAGVCRLWIHVKWNEGRAKVDVFPEIHIYRNCAKKNRWKCAPLNAKYRSWSIVDYFANT